MGKGLDKSLCLLLIISFKGVKVAGSSKFKLGDLLSLLDDEDYRDIESKRSVIANE